MTIDLSNVHGCQAELETCANGLAYLDHWWCKVLDALDDAEKDWETVEATAAAQVRGVDTHLTATEVKGRITLWIDEVKDASEKRDKVREMRRIKAKVERYFRSLEKRLSAAQTAQNGHAEIAKGGGATPPDGPVYGLRSAA